LATQLKDEEGNLLWDPSDFGQYSEDKIRFIASILRQLLTEITISTTSVAPSGSTDSSGFYTKDESDNRFLQATTAQSLIEELVKKYAESYIQDGTVSSEDFTEVRNWLIRLYRDVNGVDLDNPSEPSGVYLTSRIDDLSDKEQSDASNISAILRDLYYSNQDGSVSSTVKFASSDDMGITKEKNIITSLDADFTDRSTIVGAMNSLMAKVKSLDLNSLQSDLTNLKNGQGDISSLDSMYEGKTSTVEVLNSISDSIRTIQDRLDALENQSSTDDTQESQENPS
jgi:hypothetical protein